MARKNAVDKEEVAEFLFHEARLLDERRYDEWLSLFTEDGFYWVPLTYEQDNPYDMVSIIYDDRRALETRVRQLAKASRHAQSPKSRTNHLVGNVTIEQQPGEADGLIVRSSQQMLEWRDNKKRLFGGECLHHLVQTPGGFKIAWKRVNLIDCDGPHDGINVPI